MGVASATPFFIEVFMGQSATFIGHSDCYGVDENAIRNAIIELINEGVDEFYNGGMGGFDWLCARIVYELKQEYPHIKNYIVIPYLTFNIRNKKLFDEIIYPEGFEKYFFKSAIIKRNQYLIDNSQYAICFVKHDLGSGAAKTFSYAKKQSEKTGLKIIEV